ncbi:hypothetical protein BH708_03920 [Brachybacterium sp. P6-10-X1]|uniref:helix-turn-helix transcriptional regulator n=1 Tax=Brachybacterium sp. P6-10-X1 TaxID=1903186 RepID=UPI000971857B|nr:helix-turn-helix domain-containing protein [Brachybacterium sp. P6-10-X1]APX32016.1 hypothetical protein BH708_03920 [Brachybacterium sp. P6-10-X1]
MTVTFNSGTVADSPAVYLKPKRVEAEYGIPVGTLANLRWKGTGPRYVTAGRSILYARADIEAWLEAQAVEPVAAGR